MVTRLQRGTTPAFCVTSTDMPAQNAAIILKPLMSNPHSTPFYTWCNMLLTGLYHFPVVSIPLQNSSTPSSSLPYVHES